MRVFGERVGVEEGILLCSEGDACRHKNTVVSVAARLWELVKP